MMLMMIKKKIQTSPKEMQNYVWLGGKSNPQGIVQETKVLTCRRMVSEQISLS